MIFDSTYMVNKPDLGLRRCMTLPPQNLYSQPIKDIYGSTPPATVLPDMFGNLFTSEGGINDDSDDPVICINIEHWPKTAAAAATFENLFKMFKDQYPHKELGLYSMFPIRDYWTPVSKRCGDPEYQVWRENNKLYYDAAQQCDWIFPSLYTFYDDEEGWLDYAIHNIMEAKQYGKKISPFLWPRYHNSNQELGNRYIDDEFFSFQLKTCLDFCEAVTIWDWQNEEWDDPNWVYIVNEHI